MGIIYEPEDGSKWWIESREKSMVIHDCGKREIELDNEEFPGFEMAFQRARTLIRKSKRLTVKDVPLIEADVF